MQTHNTLFGINPSGKSTQTVFVMLHYGCTAIYRPEGEDEPSIRGCVACCQRHANEAPGNWSQ